MERRRPRVRGCLGLIWCLLLYLLQLPVSADSRWAGPSSGRSPFVRRNELARLAARQADRGWTRLSASDIPIAGDAGGEDARLCTLAVYAFPLRTLDGFLSSEVTSNSHSLSTSRPHADFAADGGLRPTSCCCFQAGQPAGRLLCRCRHPSPAGLLSVRSPRNFAPLLPLNFPGFQPLRR